MSAVSTVLSTSVSHKNEGSPRSLSTVSTSSPASTKNHFSPNHSQLSQPNSSAAAATTNVNNSGYPVYGVSPPEASTASASGIGSGGNGPTSTIDGNEIGLSRKENLDYMSHDLGISSQFCSNSETQQSSVSNSDVIIIKDPFDDDFDADVVLRNQLTNPELQQQCLSQYRAQRQALYPITDRMMLQRLPYAFNRPFIPPYPIPSGYQGNPSAYIQRSGAYPTQMPLQPAFVRVPPNQPGMMIPQGVMPPVSCPPQQQSMQAPPAKKSKSKSNKQNAPVPMPQIPPSPMMRMPMDMNRGMPPGVPIQNPYQMQMMMQHMQMQDPKCRPMMPSPLRQPKFTNVGSCFECRRPIASQLPGVICTANRQGCGGPYHFHCARLELPAAEFLKYDEIEWVCRQCSQTRQIHWG
uniref:PHD-type domain-containing protein n=1 Tax=Panagrolaimus sp. JU765 TaxID=591449 RepID=A0AC34Q637_9BILA